MANVQLKKGMDPLYHCRCKRAVVTTEDELCYHCERGIKRGPPSIDGPKEVNWKRVSENRRNN